ncbi:ribonuclease H-like domain-containing protein [Tanacetum coccineum]
MPTTHDDEDLLQIDEDAMEEIDIRWQVAMITARIRKFMRKTGRPIDLKPKNGITFDKSKIECFNCQKLGHFARECRFAKYQENRANGRNEKRIVAIEDSNSKALVATDNNEDIDWTKEFDAEPVTFAMMALTEVEQDDWSMEFNAEHVHFGQDGLGDFDWSNKADDTPVSLALMATNSEGMDSENFSRNTKNSSESCIQFQKEKGFHSVTPLQESTVGSQAVLPQTVKESAMIKSNQTWRPKGAYLDSVNRDNGSYNNSIVYLSAIPEEDLQRLCYYSGWLCGFWEMNYKEEESQEKENLEASCLDFEKFVDEDLVILRAPRKNDVYSLDLIKNIIPSGGITCLVAKAITSDEAVYGHSRLGHVLTARTLTSGYWQSVESVNRKKYCLVVTDDCSKFSWVFFLAYKVRNMIAHDLIRGFRIKHSEEHTADKEVPLSSDEQALHDELVSLMHQESLAKLHNDAQRNAFEKEKKRIALEKGKAILDDVPKDGVFSTNSFDDENTDTEEGGAADYNNMDPTIDVTSTPTLRIHKIHPQSQIIGKSTAGILTRRKLKERTMKVSQALADEKLGLKRAKRTASIHSYIDVWVLCDLPDGK